MLDEDESLVRFVVSPALSKQDGETGRGTENSGGGGGGAGG